MKKIPGSDIEVTKDDQASINQFSKLYSKNQDNQGQLASLKEKINQHRDTVDEMQLNDDDDPVRYRFGACFITMPTHRARTLVEKDIEKVEKEKATLEKQMDAVSKKMKKLKSTLYGKFGNSINLEE